MKKFVLLIIAAIIATTLNIQEVKASNTGFYEAEYAGKIYMRRTINGESKYQRARLFKDEFTGNIAYCIEPFVDFKSGTNYNQIDYINELSEEAQTRIRLLANYGYLYPGHEDIKWYAITQQLIWQTVEPSGNYEFTDSLNGNTIYPFENEITELMMLVNNHMTTPNFGGRVFKTAEDKELVLTDKNNVLNNYQSNNSNIELNNNTLKIKGLKEGIYIFRLTRKSQIHPNPALFYHKDNEQKIMTLGNANDLHTSFTVKVKKTGLEITKVDKDTNTTTPSGEGSLIGAKYGLYDKDNNLIQELTIGKNNTASVYNLAYGTYTLKELTPGTGYNLDPNTYKVEIKEENAIIKLKLSNEIIKRKIIINKEFGIVGNTKKEENITFDIYNNKNEYITSITTDKNGYVEIELPYGTYTIKQKNTTENYKTVEDFTVKIKEAGNNIKYDLYDYKIEVPDTQKNTSYFPLLLILIGLYGYKRKTV